MGLVPIRGYDAIDYSRDIIPLVRPAPGHRRAARRRGTQQAQPPGGST